jgi:hypothetical protein
MIVRFVLGLTAREDKGRAREQRRMDAGWFAVCGSVRH